MGNIIDFNLKVVGKRKKDVQEFMKILQAVYDDNTGDYTFNRHFFFIDTYPFYDLHKSGEDYYVEIKGGCKTSAFFCMCSGPYTYYELLHERCPKATTIDAESKKLNPLLQAILPALHRFLEVCIRIVFSALTAMISAFHYTSSDSRYSSDHHLTSS